MDSSIVDRLKKVQAARRLNMFRRGQSLDNPDSRVRDETTFTFELPTRPELPNESEPSSPAARCRTSRSAENIIESKAVDRSTIEANSSSTRTSYQTQSKPKATVSEESRRDILCDQLQRNVYECMVCFEKVLPLEPIWTCRQCYTIFHLSCIHKWAISSTKENDEIYGESDELQQTTWRCPSCQVRSVDVPDRSWCFCRAVQDPETISVGGPLGPQIPHSCGQICGRTSICAHACSIPCHPGACPKCLIVTTRFCCCGKESVKVICSSKTVLTCDNLCQKLLSCGIHRCIQGCHYKPCPKCEFSIMLECHCGKESKEVPCSILKIQHAKYSCGKPCDKSSDFTCRKTCHQGKCSGVQGGYWRRARIEEDRANKEICIVLIIFLIMFIFCIVLYVIFESLKTKHQAELTNNPGISSGGKMLTKSTRSRRDFHGWGQGQSKDSSYKYQFMNITKF